jgi:ribonuclease T1
MRAGIAFGLAAILVSVSVPSMAQTAAGPGLHPVGEVAIGELPKEARDTLKLIRKGGPFPYAKDGVTFGNREAHLPKQKRGYYREYTVKTPHERTRGARRIVKGMGGELYYSDDHYNSFRRILE